MKHDCLVVGGGVVGLSIAYELAKRGRRVTLLERNRVGREASWAGAGILPPPLEANLGDPLDSLRLLSHQLHAEWAEELQELSGIDNGYRDCGGLYLATTAGEVASLTGLLDLFEAHGVPAKAIPNKELLSVEPALQYAVKEGRVRMAVECPTEAQLRNPHHLRALAESCRTLGVDIVEHSPVEDITTESRRTIVHTSSRAYQAEAVFIASGAWSLNLMNGAGLTNGVFPVKGQMLLYACGEPPFRRVLNEGPRYLVARDDGHVLAGSTEEEVGFDKTTTSAGVNSLQRFAERLVPALNLSLRIANWAGLRPASFDSFPYIGRVDSVDNLFVATGHFRSGLHLSTGTARVLAQLACGETPQIDLARFSPTRG